MSSNDNPLYQYANTGGLIASGKCRLGGIFVSVLGTTPAITVYDNTSASGITPIAAFVPTVTGWYPMPFQMNNGIFIGSTGTGTNFTVAYNN